MASPSRSKVPLRALCEPFHPTPEYLENGPQLSFRAQTEIQRYREFNRPVVPTSSSLDNRHSYGEIDTRYPRRQSSGYHSQLVAGDSWRRHDQDAGPIRYPYPRPVLPPLQSQHAAYSHPSGPSIQTPFTHRGSSPRLYSLSQNPYSRPAASLRPQRLYSYSRLSPQTTYCPLHYERSPQKQYSYFLPSGSPVQPQYSSVLVDSPLHLPVPSHPRAGPSLRPHFSSYSQPRQSSPLPLSSLPHHPSSHTGPSTRPPGSLYLEPRASRRTDPPSLPHTPLVSPYTLPPPVAPNASRRPDIRNLLSDPLDELEAQERSLDWLLQEAQRRGIDVKAILISHLYPQPISSNNQLHLLRDESQTRKRKRYLSGDDIGAGPRHSKRREIESRQIAGARITPGDGGSAFGDSERDGTESGEETARNDNSDSEDKTISRDKTIVPNMGDQSSKYSGGAIQDENTRLYESARNTSYNGTKVLDENSPHDGSTTHNQSTTYNVIPGGGESEPMLRQTKTKGKRKVFTVANNDGDGDSGPSSLKRPKIRSNVDTSCHNKRPYETPRSSGSKDGPPDHDIGLVDATPDNAVRDKKANPTSRGLSVPLRRSLRNPKTRVPKS